MYKTKRFVRKFFFAVLRKSYAVCHLIIIYTDIRSFLINFSWWRGIVNRIMIYGAITSCKVGEKVANCKFSEPKSLDPMFFLETRSFQKFVVFFTLVSALPTVLVCSKPVLQYKLAVVRSSEDIFTHFRWLKFQQNWEPDQWGVYKTGYIPVYETRSIQSSTTDFWGVQETPWKLFVRVRDSDSGFNENYVQMDRVFTTS